MSSEILGIGAEAVVKREGDVVIKERIAKRYRHEAIDRRIREERNKKEARLLKKASRALRVPKVIEVEKFRIKMEFIDGKKVRDVKISEEIAEKIGEIVGKLHALGIAHNDLTTSNMIIKNGEIWLIDFGLADYGKIEDFATDLKVLRDSMRATHGDMWKFVVKGYERTMPKSKEVLERLQKVDERGRYKIRSSR